MGFVLHFSGYHHTHGCPPWAAPEFWEDPTLRTHLIATAFILLLALSASGADNATDAGAVRLAGNASYQSMSGDLYKSYYGYDENQSRIGVSLAIESFSARGVSQGLTFAVLSNTYGSYRLTDYAIGARFSFYLVHTADRDLKGRFLPFLRLFFDYQEGESLPEDNYRFTGGLQFGFDAMLTEAVALELGARWRTEKRSGSSDYSGGSAIDFQAGLAYFLF